MEPDPLPAPWTVRAAGALVTVQGLLAAAIGVALLLRPLVAEADVDIALGGALWFAVIAAAMIAVGVALWRGRHGARSPAIVTEALLLGVAWYAAGPSSQPAYGIPGGLYCLAVLVLLFCAPTGRWMYGTVPDGRINERRPAD